MKKIALLGLALVIALGSLGVGYALWWDDLLIDGIVCTGDIGVEWSIEDYFDNEAPEKDVSSIEAYFPDLADPSVMWIDIWNAYPSITYTVAWDLHCTGTVPVHFAAPMISGDLPAGAELTFTDEAGNIIDWSQVQLHQGDYMYGLLTVHLDNDALQNECYGFAIYLEYGQYNEF